MRNGKLSKTLVNERGDEVPLSTIAAHEIKRHEIVMKLIKQSTALQEHTQKQKKSIFSQIERFLTACYENNGIRYEGKKGNFTLFSYDQQYKIVFSTPEDLMFTEELQVALKAMRECVQDWIADGRDELRTLLQDLMNVDRQGRINRYQVIRFFKIESQDPRWQKAQRLIKASMKVVKNKNYLRFYQKDERGNWNHLTLNFSDL